MAAEILSYPLGGRPAKGRIAGSSAGRAIRASTRNHHRAVRDPGPVFPRRAQRGRCDPAGGHPGPTQGAARPPGLVTVTIDGEKARDFDDAVSIERIRSGYRLWVHIADVAHYVKEGTVLDEEAYQRGTSVYLPDRAMPMLPEALSNGICSLNPQVDRLTLTCEMDIARRRRPAVRHLRKRDQQQRAHDLHAQCADPRGPRPLAAEALRAAAERVRAHGELMEVLRAKRAKRGSIDFDLPEPEIVLDLQGRMTEIIRAERNMAHQIVEEFMLAANETVAAHIEKKKKRLPLPHP